MLLAWVQQEAGSGFDDRAELMTLQGGGYLRELGGGSFLVRIECAVIQRDGDAAVADLGQQRDGVEEIVMSEAVGVVGEEHEMSARPSNPAHPECHIVKAVLHKLIQHSLPNVSNAEFSGKLTYIVTIDHITAGSEDACDITQMFIRSSVTIIN